MPDREAQVADHRLVAKIDGEMINLKQWGHWPRLQHHRLGLDFKWVAHPLNLRTRPFQLPNANHDGCLRNKPLAIARGLPILQIQVYLPVPIVIPPGVC